jgi:hypothetical protein
MQSKVPRARRKFIRMMKLGIRESINKLTCQDIKTGTFTTKFAKKGFKTISRCFRQVTLMTLWSKKIIQSILS